MIQEKINIKKWKQYSSNTYTAEAEILFFELNFVTYINIHSRSPTNIYTIECSIKFVLNSVILKSINLKKNYAHKISWIYDINY